MAVAGQTLDSLVRNVWAPTLFREYFLNNWFFDESMFQVKKALGGDTISTGYRYAVTTNTGSFAYDDPMVEPFNTSEVRAYFNKQSFQEAARIFLTKVHYRENGGYEVMINDVQDALKEATANLFDIATTTMLTSLEGQIDATSNYSDAALARATYTALASYEESTATALTLAHLEDLMEALLQRTTYGVNVRSKDELLFMMPQNQITNLSRLATGAQYLEFNASSQGGPIDAGRVFRTEKFEGVQIVGVPDMTSTVILCVHKPNIIIHQTEPFMVEEKDEAAHTRLWKLTVGYNIEAKRPNNHAKLSGKTA